MPPEPRFDPHSVVPLYIQAADYLAEKITRGELAPGQKLPGERDLAIEWEVAYETVQRAMRELKSRGLVEARVGKGTFVKREG